MNKADDQSIPQRWPEQYNRLLRWRARLDEPGADEQHRRDDFYAFFVAAHHLADWIGNDATVAEDVRKAVWKVRDTGTLAHAADVANGFKHLKRWPGSAEVDEAAHVSVYGTFAVGEEPWKWEHVVGVVGDLPREDAYEMADRCIGEWDVFLHEHGLRPRTTPASADVARPRPEKKSQPAASAGRAAYRHRDPSLGRA